MTDLEKRVAQLEQIVLQLSRNIPNIVSDVDDTSNRVDAITPYTAVKTAYYGETEKTFYNVPQGNASVFFDKYIGNYSVTRAEDRLAVWFDALSEQTQITISIQ